MTQSPLKYSVLHRIVVNENAGLCNWKDPFGQTVVHNISAVNKDVPSHLVSFLIYCNLHKKISIL